MSLAAEGYFIARYSMMMLVSGTTLVLDAGDAEPDELAGLAEETLDNLAREVADNLQAS